MGHRRVIGAALFRKRTGTAGVILQSVSAAFRQVEGGPRTKRTAGTPGCAASGLDQFLHARDQ